MAESGVYLPPEADVEFPNPRTIEGDIVATGGNLSPGMLLSAYRRGIFPWFSEGDPILWWSLNPRFVIFPARFHISRSLRKTIRKNPFTLTLDADFAAVMEGCRDSWRPGQDGTWITADMFEGYVALHELGYAHSVEAWKDGKLAGGLYGVSLGGCFYGESMFTRVTDASKVAFAALGGILADADFGLIDCQQHTRHLSSFGAIDMQRSCFLDALEKELMKPTLLGDWGGLFPDFPSSRCWQEITGGSRFCQQNHADNADRASMVDGKGRFGSREESP